MPKPNAYISQIEAKYNARFLAKLDMLLQMGQDAAMIAASDTLQLGKGRAEAFCVAYRDAMNDMAGLMWADQHDDKEFVYAKHQIDQRIRQIVGDENFAPWEERYKV